MRLDVRLSLVTFVVVLLAGPFTVRPVCAHAFLDHAEPRVGSTVQGSLAAVTLVFTEAVEASFSHIGLTDASDQAVKTGPLDHPSTAELRVAFPPLIPGIYTVHWAVTSVDTHQTSGTFEFTLVAP